MSNIKKMLIELKHRSKLLTLFWYLARKPYFWNRERIKQQEVKRRKNGYEEPRYINLKKYKNIHLGERCFIIATGPSLTMADLEFLKNEYTFGMNSIVKLYEKTKWRPTYFGIQDARVYEKLENTICTVYKDANNVFISDEIAGKYEVPINFNQFPYDVEYHFNQLEIDKYFARFSDDCYSIVYDGYSITYSLMQIAIYMGFKEIYLVGADCSYKRGAKNHIVESGNDDRNEEKNYEKMIIGYQKAKEYADTHNIKIVNCTRGGMLEIYPRMSLEEVLNGR